MPNRKSGKPGQSQPGSGDEADRGAASSSPSGSQDQGAKKGRGRPKGSKNTPPPDLRVVAGTAIGSNSTLTDSEEKVLFFQHLNSYERGLEAFKKAQADLRNIGKKAKADLGAHAVSLLKIAIDLRADEGPKDLQERMDREARVARWMGLPLGAQGSLFEPDRRTAGDKAEEEGFSAGSDQTTPRTPPEKYGLTGDNARRWYHGFDKAQEAIFLAMEKKGTPVLRGSDQAPEGPDPRIAEAEATKEEGEDEGHIGSVDGEGDPLDDNAED